MGDTRIPRQRRTAGVSLGLLFLHYVLLPFLPVAPRHAEAQATSQPALDNRASLTYAVAATGTVRLTGDAKSVVIDSWDSSQPDPPSCPTPPCPYDATKARSGGNIWSNGAITFKGRN